MASIGVLHPGEMGSAVGEVAASRAEVLWAPEGRSEATSARARAAGLEPAPLDELLARSEIVLSIVPPHAALEVAREVAGRGFGGIYVDANAISPATVREVAEVVGRAVDGGFIGGPPREPGTTRLCLSGSEADRVAALFAGSPLEPWVLGDEIGTASALKMVYAAWTKGTAAMLLAIVEVAEAHGLRDELAAEWARSQPALAERAGRTAADVAPKAWRWIFEMEEIAATFEAAGVPGGFHQAAARMYERLHARGVASVS